MSPNTSTHTRRSVPASRSRNLRNHSDTSPNNRLLNVSGAEVRQVNGLKSYQHHREPVLDITHLHPTELKEAVRTWPHSDPISWAQRTTAVALVKRLDQSFDKAVAALQQNDPKYYQEFEPLLSWRFWLIPQEWSSTDPSLVYPSTMTTECYDEQLSDKCLTLLLGTWKMNGTPCIVTKPCRDTMTRFGCPHYSLSHQLLYFMIGKMKGCSNLLKGDTRASRANMTERNYEKIFCSNMMKTNQDIIKDGLTEQTVDIFIENRTLRNDTKI
eukprot:superscaffoldBa00009330_g24024